MLLNVRSCGCNIIVLSIERYHGIEKITPTPSRRRGDCNHHLKSQMYRMSTKVNTRARALANPYYRCPNLEAPILLSSWLYLLAIC